MEWLNEIYWHNSVRAWLVAAGMTLGGLLLGWLLSALLKRWIIRGYDKTVGRFDDLLAGVGHRLVWWMIFLAGLHAASQALKLPAWLAEVLLDVFVVLWTVLGAVFVSRLTRGFIVHYLKRHAEQTDSLLDEQLVPIIRSVVGITVWLLAGLFALANLGFNIGSILAGLGIGGLALAMASKDLLSNVFGAFTILMQGPFRVGDAVNYQGHSGKIESLGLRATELRTYDGHLVTVPNALATTSVVENVSARPTFRVLFKLGLEYGTSPKQCDQAAELMKAAITSVEGTGAEPLVHFIEFGDSALVFQVLYHIEDTDRILDIRHQVNRGIHQALASGGLNIAFPTVTVQQAAQST